MVPLLRKEKRPLYKKEKDEDITRDRKT